MQRKYIYIIIILLTVIFCSTKYYLIDLSGTPVIIQSESKNQDSNIDDTYIEAIIKSPVVIKNLQNDDNEINYKYSIKISNLSGAYKCTIGSQDTYLIFSANGKSEFTLKSNEKLTIYDVPNELEYTIEQLTNVDDTYTTKANDVISHIATGTIYLETNIIFENNTKIPNEEIEKPGTRPENKPSEDSKKPEKDDNNKEENPIKPNSPETTDKNDNDNDDNPVTSDKIPFIAILTIAILLVIINIKSTKIKRFE